MDLLDFTGDDMYFDQALPAEVDATDCRRRGAL